MSRHSPVLLAALLLTASAACRAQPAPPAAESDVYSYRTPSRDGIGKIYMGREIAQVMGYQGLSWLERPERQSTEMPDRVVDALGLEPGDVVADIGAGSGYFSFRIAARVPAGKVLAVDIQPEMLAVIEERSARDDIGNVEAILGTETDPNLPEVAVDLALMVDAYHELSHPRELMEAIVRALKPGGRVVLVEYRGEDPEVPIKELHKMTEDQARREMEAAGLRWRETLGFLPQQHVLVFEKPQPAAQRRRVVLMETDPGIVAPQLVRQPTPRFPEAARRQGRRDATVLVRVLIGENGEVLTAELAGEQQGEGLDAEALDAARRSVYTPATKNGVPVKIWRTQAVEFRSE